MCASTTPTLSPTAKGPGGGSSSSASPGAARSDATSDANAICPIMALSYQCVRSTVFDAELGDVEAPPTMKMNALSSAEPGSQRGWTSEKPKLFQFTSSGAPPAQPGTPVPQISADCAVVVGVPPAGA